jgi:5-methylcytosine-specific restriction endonuclease McrA
MSGRALKRERRALFDAQGQKCAYCDELMTWHAGPRQCTLDHVIPKYEGGADGLKVAACHQCNRLKGCLTAPQIRKLADRIEYLLTRASRARESEAA